jgi:hypothetical protein
MTCPKYTPEGFKQCTRDPNHDGPCAHPEADTEARLKQIIYDLLDTSKSDATGYVTLEHLRVREAAVKAIEGFKPRPRANADDFDFYGLHWSHY